MRLHLIDGTYELFRAHHSKRPPHHDAGGRDLKATVGLVSSLLALLHDEEESVSHVAVAFDNPIRSFRNDLFDGYKTEEGVPDEVLAQFDLVEEAVAALGVTVWSMDEYEADDALGTAARRFVDEVQQVRICTPDKDLGQAVRGDSIVLVDRRRGVVVDEDGVRERHGVAPSSVPDLLALVGDTADGIPGLPGFGAVSAGRLLARFPHLEDVPRLADRWPPGIRGARRLAGVLAERFDDALLYRRLATLVGDVPLDGALDDLAWDGVPRDAFVAWCDAVDAGRLRDRPTRWA